MRKKFSRLYGLKSRWLAGPAKVRVENPIGVEGF